MFLFFMEIKLLSEYTWLLRQADIKPTYVARSRKLVSARIANLRTDSELRNFQRGFCPCRHRCPFVDNAPTMTKVYLPPLSDLAIYIIIEFGILFYNYNEDAKLILV